MTSNPPYLNDVPSPCYVCEEAALEKNLQTLERVQKESGAKILLALKGFAMWSTFDLVGKYLHGTAASGLHEALLGREKMCNRPGGPLSPQSGDSPCEVHTYSPAFKSEELDEIARISDHLVFNSTGQFKRFAKQAKKANPDISIGIRINPEVSSAPTDIYNPCGLYSRLGTVVTEFDESVIGDGVDGLHFHALCEQNVDALEAVLVGFEAKFGHLIGKMKWINFGGGHHITRADYDVDGLIRVLKDFRARHNNIPVYLEPGEAVGWQTGPLVATVLDIVKNGMELAILDTSAEAHMPDTLAMPYRAMIRNSGEAGEKKYTYRLGGNTCLAGDIIGDYSFDEPLKPGDRLVFEDQIHYTFVKNTTFNGIKLPSLAIYRKDGSVDVVKNFGYNDFKNRLS